MAARTDSTGQPRAEDARAFLDAILACSDAAIVGRARDGTIVSWNKAAELLYGYSAAEAVGRRLRLPSARTAGDRTRQRPPRDGADQKGWRSGPRGPSISPVRNRAGEVTGTAVIAREIVARTIIDSQSTSEAKFQSLFEGNPLPMLVYDCETLRFLEVNDAAVAHYGYSRDEFLGMRIADIRPAEDIPRLERLLAGERPRIRQSGVWRHRLRDGSLIPVEIVSHLVNWNGRRAALVVAQDVSERTRAEEALRASEERFRTAFEHAPFGMCLSARDGRFLQVNAAFSQMLGYSERELLNGAWQNLTHPADLERPNRRFSISWLVRRPPWNWRNAMSTRTAAPFGPG